MNLRWVGLMVSALVLGACGGGDDDDGPVDPGPTKPAEPDPHPSLAYAVDAPGPFRVGHRWVRTSYAPPNGLPERAITVHLWYPTEDAAGEASLYVGKVTPEGVFKGATFPDAKAFEGASLAAPVDAAGYPVHVHSHGKSAFGGSSADLMRWYASHGWVAIAPDHEGTLISQNADKLPVSIYYLRALDIRASLDAAAALPASDPLAGKLRTDRVVMSGHSAGAMTTWAVLGARFDGPTVQALCDEGKFSDACTPGDVAVFTGGLGDARVVAGVPMAGSAPEWFPGDAYDAGGKPALLLTASGDPVRADEVYGQIAKLDFGWVEFQGGCHQLFALGGCKDFPSSEGFPLVDTYALALGRQHVLGDTGARTLDIVHGRAALSSRVTVHRKDQTP